MALTISGSGLYRVSGSMLVARGVSWSGDPAADIAVSLGGQSVPRVVSAHGAMSPGSYVEFYARPPNSMYTSSTMYRLSVDPSLARPVQTIANGKDAGTPVDSYTASWVGTPGRGCEKSNGGCLYEPMAPGGKWFWNQTLAEGSPSVLAQPVTLDSLVPAGQASLELRLWGVTDFGGPFPQHHIQALVNGHLAVDVAFSGSVQRSATASFPASWLRSGRNTITFRQPGDVKNDQSNLDIIDIRSFTLRYPRAFRARNGDLSFQAVGDEHVVGSGFAGADIQVWQTEPAVRLLTGARVDRSRSGYAVDFETPAAGAFLVTAGAQVPDAIRRVPPTSYLDQGTAGELIIAPRRFWSALQPLIIYHESHGTPVKLADPTDIYFRYGTGSPDASALRAYITSAETQLGITSVLLVGADTYDYHGYIDCASVGCPGNPNDVSVIPSMYLDDSYFGQIPSDELLIDSHGAPSLAIGRIPALSTKDVKAAVSNEMWVISHPAGDHTAVMATGVGEPDFSTTTAALAHELPPGYAVTAADETAQGHRQARRLLLAGIRAGDRLVDFVGHGNLDQWSQNPLLSVTDVGSLHPRERGQAYFGWGCQTAYDVDPTDRALNARLLQSGGAAITIGSTGLDLAPPQSELAEALFHELFADPTVESVGEAWQQAEASAFAADPATEDSIRSYEIFGDPAMPTSVLR